MRRDDTETKEADVDENGLTMKEERELKWAQENEELETAGMDKVAMRAYYKVGPFFVFLLPRDCQTDTSASSLCSHSEIKR